MVDAEQHLAAQHEPPPVVPGPAQVLEAERKCGHDQHEVTPAEQRGHAVQQWVEIGPALGHVTSWPLRLRGDVYRFKLPEGAQIGRAHV